MPASTAHKPAIARKQRPTSVTENPAVRRYIEECFQLDKSYPFIIEKVRRRFRVTLSHSAVSRHWQRWNARMQRAS